MQLLRRTAHFREDFECFVLNLYHDEIWQIEVGVCSHNFPESNDFHGLEDTWPKIAVLAEASAERTSSQRGHPAPATRRERQGPRRSGPPVRRVLAEPLRGRVSI